MFKGNSVAKMVGVGICTLMIFSAANFTHAGDQEHQKAVKRSPDAPDDPAEAKALKEEMAAQAKLHYVRGPIPRYLVTYMESITAAGWTTRSATVVTVTNQSSQPCVVRVYWYKGFGLNPVCTTESVLPSRMTGDFCSRNLPMTLTTCNSTCSPQLVYDEGRAIVSSTCEEIGVSSRVYYTTENADSNLTAITDSKIVRWSEGNIGD